MESKNSMMAAAPWAVSCVKRDQRQQQGHAVHNHLGQPGHCTYLCQAGEKNDIKQNNSVLRKKKLQQTSPMASNLPRQALLAYGSAAEMRRMKTGQGGPVRSVITVMTRMRSLTG